MAFDAFLKLDGINGESIDESYTGWIEVESFSWGASNPGSPGKSAGGGGAGKVSVQDFHFTMSSSKASPNLLLACANGKHIPTGTLACRKAGGDAAGKSLEFMRIKLTDVLVSSYQIGENPLDAGYSALGGSEDLPTDEVTLNFIKFEFLWTSQPADGGIGDQVDQGWDTVGNAPFSTLAGGS